MVRPEGPSSSKKDRGEDSARVDSAEQSRHSRKGHEMAVKRRATKEATDEQM